MAGPWVLMVPGIPGVVPAFPLYLIKAVTSIKFDVEAFEMVL